MAEIDTSSQAPIYNPTQTVFDPNADTQDTINSSTIQKNGDVITDSQTSLANPASNAQTSSVALYASDASLPKLPLPTDSRIQVGFAAQSLQSDSGTDADADTAPSSNSSSTSSAQNGEEPSLFVDVQGRQNPNGNGQGSDSGSSAQGQQIAQGAQIDPKTGLPVNPGQPQADVQATADELAAAAKLAAGETGAAQGAQGAQSAQAGASISGTNGTFAADLQQFNPDLPANDPFQQDPLNDFAQAAALLFGTDYSQGEAPDADAPAGSSQAGAQGASFDGESATMPLAGDPNSSVLPDGTILVVNGEQVTVNASAASGLTTPIINVGGDTSAEGAQAIVQTPAQAAALAAQVNNPAAANLLILNNLEKSSVTLNDILLQAQNLAKGLPDSKEKATFLNFLASVSQNLLALNDMLYKLQIINTEQSREATQAQKEAAITDIQKRAKAEQKRLKAESKKRKKAKLGILNKIFSVIKIVFMAVALAMVQMIPGLGQIAGAYIAAAMVDEVCKTYGINYSMTQALNNAVANAVVGMMPYLSDSAKESVRTAVKGMTAAINLAVMFLSPVSFALGGGATIQATLIDSDLIKSKALKAKLGMALGVAQAVAGVVLAIVMCFIPGGQGAAFGAITSALGTTTARALDVLKNVLNVVMAAVTITGQINDAVMASINQLIAKIKGAYESSQALIQMLIQLLKQAIKTLQDGIKEFASQIAGIQGALQANFSNLAAELGALYNAT